MKKLKGLPVPILPTMVGACTLSNVYNSNGFTWVRHITFIAATIVLLLYILKIFCYNETVRNEYSNTVPCSLYAGFSMLFMLLGSYYFDFNNTIGKAMWLFGLAVHACHILVFTYRNVIKGFEWSTFVPSWFVTYNGIMVSTVIGGVMNEPLICKVVVYYGIAVFTLIIPFMLYRLITKPIGEGVYHTQAILLAPSSLCLVSYLNMIENPNPYIVYYLYIAVALALLFIIIKLPSFFAFSFTPAFAGLTFPMAIGIVASTKFSAFLSSQGMEAMSNVIKEVSGIQLYLTSGLIFFVLLNFVIMLKKSFKN